MPSRSAPAICVGLDLTSKVGRREAADIQRLIGKTGLHFLGLQSRAQDAAERLDGPAGSPRRNKNAEPFGEFERRVPRLGNGWHIGQQRAALCARHCQRPQRPGPDMRNEGADGRDAGGDLTTQQTLYGGRRSLKGNVEILKVRSPGQHDAEEMKSASVFTVLGTSGPIAISMDVVEIVVTGAKSCCGL